MEAQAGGLGGEGEVQEREHALGGEPAPDAVDGHAPAGIRVLERAAEDLAEPEDSGDASVGQHADAALRGAGRAPGFGPLQITLEGSVRRVSGGGSGDPGGLGGLRGRGRAARDIMAKKGLEERAGND